MGSITSILLGLCLAWDMLEGVTMSLAIAFEGHGGPPARNNGRKQRRVGL